MIPTKSLLFALLVCGGACRASEPEPRFEREPARATPDTAPSAAVAAPAPEPPRPPPQATPEAKPAITRQPTSPDPLAGKFGLAEATRGLPKQGALRAAIETGYGAITCKLFADKAPVTVANFVGLARGLRPFWDAKQAAWVKRPLYDGTSFHRAIAGFMIQGGDPLGDGSGEVGYEIPDELVPGLTHDKAGLLCMANRGPNTNGGQFFITDAAAPHLTQMKSYTIFGECAPLEVISKIARAPRPHAASERPEPLVPITRVQISKQ